MAHGGKHCRPGLANSCRNEDGQIREKRGDTEVGTLRKKYGPDFARGVRGDMHLDTLLGRQKAASLSQLLKGK